MAVTQLAGPRVRAIREVFHITQAEFAQAVGITGAYLSKIEAGIQQPSPKLARRIVDQLLMSVDQGLISYGVSNGGDEAVA